MLFVRCWNCLGVNLLFPAGPSFRLRCNCGTEVRKLRSSYGGQVILAWTGSRDETKLARGVWTFSCACFNRPKGEQRIAQAFRPGNHTNKELALKGRPSESLSMNVAFGNHALQSAAHSGRIYRRCFPRPECFRAWAVLFSPFGRRRNVQTPGTRRPVRHSFSEGGSSSRGRDEARPYQALMM